MRRSWTALAAGFWLALAAMSGCLATSTAAAKSSARFRPAIVGGSDAPPGSYGFMAFVIHYDTNDDADFVCSGTVIANNIVLTAGHCAVDENTGAALAPEGFVVVTGSRDWSDSSERQLSYVSRVAVEPNYVPASGAADAALLVLSTPTTAPTVPIATTGDQYLYNGGAPALVAGWGTTYAGGPAVTMLQWAPTKVQAASYCGAVYTAFSTKYGTCAVDSPGFAAGTCNGDSGGPLLATDPAGRQVELGVTSLGPVDCDTDTGDFFTRTDQIASWASTVAKSVGPGLPNSPTPPSTPTATTAAPSPPPLTISDARAYANYVVKRHTGKRPRIGVSCARLNTWRLNCSLKWRHAASAYEATGQFWHFETRTGASWGYDFAGTRTWRTCAARREHTRRPARCTAHRSRFHWR
jgi:secreted trypsin-like serine protease